MPVPTDTSSLPSLADQLPHTEMYLRPMSTVSASWHMRPQTKGSSPPDSSLTVRKASLPRSFISTLMQTSYFTPRNSTPYAVSSANEPSLVRPTLAVRPSVALSLTSLPSSHRAIPPKPSVLPTS